MVTPVSAASSAAAKVPPPPGTPVIGRPRPAVHRMRKDDLLHELREWNVPVKETWSVCELRQLLIDKYKEYPPEGKLEGLASKKLAVLRSMCEEKGIAYTENMTRGRLMMLIRSHHDKGILTGADPVEFGKYQSQTYLDVAADKGYCDWVLEMDSTDDKASPALRRLARWLREGDTPQGWTLEGSSPRAKPARAAAELSTEAVKMEAEAGAEAIEEISRLEARLASLKSIHGLTNSSPAASSSPGASPETPPGLH